MQTFNVLQQRLEPFKVVSTKLMKDYPVHLRAYDLLGDGENDLRTVPFDDASGASDSEVLIAGSSMSRPVDLSPAQFPSTAWEALTAARADPASAGAGEDLKGRGRGREC